MRNEPQQVKSALIVLGLGLVIIVAAFVAHPQPTRATTAASTMPSGSEAPLIVELVGPVYRVKIFAGSEHPVCTIIRSNDGVLLAHGLSLPEAQIQFPDLPSLASAVPGQDPDDGWITIADVPD